MSAARRRRRSELQGYGAVVDRFLSPAWETVVKRRPTLRYRALLARTERASLDELASIQHGKLVRLLRHAAAHVPYYRERFAAIGFEPGDLRTLDDLARLPVLSRDEARQTVTQRTSTASPHVAFRAVTGGTLGSSLAFGYDRDTEWWRTAARLRAWGWAGYRVGSRTLYYVGVNHGLNPPRGQRVRTAIERTLKRERYVSCMVRDDDRLARVAEVLRRFHPEIIVCYPQAGADLARYLRDQGRAGELDVGVLCHGEKLYDRDRQVMQEAFGPRIFETYAARETFMIASECEAHAGLHVAMENVLVEVLAETGGSYRPAAPGELGLVVITDLNNLGMPFIRYALGDLAVAPRVDACACGRTLPRMGPVEGRAVEALRGPNGERVSSTLFEQILMNTLGASMERFQIVQHASLDITLRIAPGHDLKEASLRSVLSACRALIPGLAVRTELTELPPDSTGKRRVVIVEGPSPTAVE